MTFGYYKAYFDFRICGAFRRSCEWSQNKQHGEPGEDKHQIQVTAQVENVKERPKTSDSTRGQSEANSQIKHGGRETKKIIKGDLLDEEEEKKIKDLLKGGFSGKERVKDLLEEESIVNIVEEGRKEMVKGRGESLRGKLKNHKVVDGKHGEDEDGILEEVKDLQNNKKTTGNPKEDDGNEETKDEQKKEDQDPMKEVEKNICVKGALTENSSQDPLAKEEDTDDPNYSSVSFLL
jgi:hypothetical protein